MKLKILILFMVITIGVTGILASASKNQRITSQSTVKEAETQTEPGVTQHVEDIPQKQFNHSENTMDAKQVLSEEKLRELEGHINKEYGIREDILRYIEKEIPADNEKAKKAAIKYARRMNLVYYHANQKEALIESRNEIIALNCLSNSMPENWLQISRGITNLMRDTKERDEHIWDIAKRYFSWKILGNGGLSTKQLEELCKSGEF